ncbi:MAG TPA: T9SS type A sorting domain-containing protein [Candidatus Eisenbacteria bacterium]|nr:T9SS type A sorting domain-containing protein [Candidatus Eisenbacteria bacterium]
MKLPFSNRDSRPRSTLLIAWIVILAASPAFAGSWTGDFSIPAFDGSVRACAFHGGQHVVAGSFQWAGGVHASNVARWTGTQWASVGEGLSQPVARLTNWGSDLLAATTSFGAGSPVMRFSGGSWRALGPALQGSAEALLATQGELYVAGNLLQEGLPQASRVMRWQGGAWHPVGGAFDGRVLALAVYDGELYAGGEFVFAEDQFVSRIARWDGTLWQPVGGAGGPGGNPAVNSLVVYDGRLVAGGYFSTLGGETAKGVGAWNGQEWEALPDTPQDALISDLLVEGNLLHAAGVLQVPNLWASGFATFDGESWSVPTPYPDWSITDIAGWDGTVQASPIPSTSVVGAFVELMAVGETSALLSGPPAFDRAPIRDVIVRDPTWRALTPWQPQMRGLLGPSWTEVKALHVHAGELYAGGYFEYAAEPPGWTSTGPLARWANDRWEPVDAGLRGWVHALASWNDQLVIGGTGFFAEGRMSSVLAREGDDWSALGGELQGYVTGLTEWQGALVAAGGLRLLGQQSWSGVAVHRTSGWEILGEPLVADQSSISAVAVFRGELFVAGATLNAQAGVGSLMRWDGDRWTPVLHTPAGIVKCLLPRADGLWVGFANYGGSPRSSIWRWDGFWKDMGGLSGDVFVLAEHDNDVYAGGWLYGVGSLARWGGGSGPDDDYFNNTWAAIPDGPASAIGTMASLGKDLWVGGWFTRLGRGQAEAVARWTSAAAAGPVRAGSITAWPNPARERTAFRFSLPRAGRVTLDIYDLHGAKVATLVDEELPGGPVERSWSIPKGRVPAGIYFARLEGPGVSWSAKVVVAR